MKDDIDPRYNLKGWSMKHRLAVVFSALVLLLGLGAANAVAATALPTHASSHTAPHVKEHAAVANQGAAFCSQNGSGYCLNRNQCGGFGAKIIMWYHDFDNCEDFVPSVLNAMCNYGKVSSTCPFTVGSGLNNRYLNQYIVAIQSQSNGGECVATTSGGLGTVGACPNGLGNGGANGSIFVWTNNRYVINRYWSNYNYSIGEANAPSWMCSPGSVGQQVLLYDDTGSAGICQWNYGL